MNFNKIAQILAKEFSDETGRTCNVFYSPIRSFPTYLYFDLKDSEKSRENFRITIEKIDSILDYECFLDNLNERIRKCISLINNSKKDRINVTCIDFRHSMEYEGSYDVWEIKIESV